MFTAIRKMFATEIKVTLPAQENAIPMERTTSKRDKPSTSHGEWQVIKKAYYYTVSYPHSQCRHKGSCQLPVPVGPDYRIHVSLLDFVFFPEHPEI